MDYLENEWSQRTLNKFIKTLDKSILLIKKYPESNELSNIKEGLYRCVITKHISLFYTFNSTEIYVITFFDTRMHPYKLKKEIKKHDRNN